MTGLMTVGRPCSGAMVSVSSSFWLFSLWFLGGTANMC